MPQRVLLLSAPFVNAGEVVVRVGVSGIERDRAFVRAHGVGGAAEVFQGDAEVEGGGLVIGIAFERGAVVFLGKRGGALLVQDAAEVHVGIGMVGLDFQRALIRVDGL